MKINPRIYDYCDPEKVLERQELQNNVVEIYKLNDYPDLFEDFIAKGKFAVWSSADGKDYRLYIEEGYYEKLKPLYSKKINSIWLGFWDDCESITSKFRNIVMPLMVGVVALVIFFSMILKNYATAKNILVILIPLAFFGFVMFYRRVINRNIMISNSKSVEEIKKYLGSNKFEQLLESQRTYIDEYFNYEDESDLDDELETENLFLENNGEVVEAEVEAETDTTIEE